MKSIVLVLSTCEAERKKIIGTVCAKWSEHTVVRYDVGSCPVREFIEKMHSLDLLSPASLFIYEGVEALKKEEATLLAASLIGTVILSGSGYKGVKDSSYTIYDLTQEKPWERPNRLKQWLGEEARALGKTLSPQVLTRLVDEVSSDFGCLRQELLKLACYVGERTVIEPSDMEAIVFTRQSAGGWQVAETLVWEGKLPLRELPFEMGLIGQVRYHLQMGQQIASLLSQGASPSAILAAIPNLKQRALDKYLPIVKTRSALYFKRCLSALLKAEIACKNSVLPPHLHWARFQAELLS